MIHRVYSTLPTFKTLRLRSGMNVLLADKGPNATDRQTRNGAGKTSFVELIHFLTGSSCDKDSIFRNEELIERSFGMEFDLGGVPTAVERSGAKPNRLKVGIEGASGTLRRLKEDGWDEGLISNTNWRKSLGSLMFDLKRGTEEEEHSKFGPTFRSLFSYFARRQSSQGFTSPIKTSAQQQPFDFQVAVTFLLGLDWTIPQSWQHVREREKALGTLRKEAAKGTFGAYIGTTADLRTELTVVEERTRKLRENIRGFRILPEYRDLEREASEAVQRLGELADGNTIDLQLIAELEESFRREKPPEVDNLSRLYAEAGVVLPENVSRRFDDVRLFHESVIRNRKSYLGSEIKAARRRIEDRDTESSKLESRYGEVMRILKSHGALDQYTRLQSELSKLEAQTEAVRERFTAAERLADEKTVLDIERDRLVLRLNQDYREQEEVLKHAIVVFEEMSSSLYEEAGSLTVDASRNGPVFDVKIHGEKSKGINNMQIFCFDMMLMQLCSERGTGPGFLVHDSHLFDGVDERQVGKALELGARKSRELGFQYIVTLNSDAVPSDLPSGFSLEEFILPVRLTDAIDNGGLFGIKFG